MNTDYWQRIAPRFESEIFNVFANDRKGLIVSRIRKLGSSRKSATDLGCGIGNFLPALSQAFGSVLAVDVSSKTLNRAKAASRGLGNVSYMKLDLSSPKAKLPKVDFALSVNTLLTPSLAKNTAMLDSTIRHIAKGGHLLLVVPALESALLSRFMLIQWDIKDGKTLQAAIRGAADGSCQPGTCQLTQGIVPIDGVPTKHFLREELIALLSQRRMTTLEIKKIEYPWTTEFANPPRWMKEPFPWDWLVLAQKTSK